MALIRLTNDLHRTMVRLRVAKVGDRLSKGQVRRARRELCSDPECSCSGGLGTRGPQEARIGVEYKPVYHYQGPETGAQPRQAGRPMAVAVAEPSAMDGPADRLAPARAARIASVESFMLELDQAARDVAYLKRAADHFRGLDDAAWWLANSDASGSVDLGKMIAAYAEVEPLPLREDARASRSRSEDASLNR